MLKDKTENSELIQLKNFLTEWKSTKPRLKSKIPEKPVLCGSTGKKRGRKRRTLFVADVNFNSFLKTHKVRF
jgi:hypothetical protein